MVFYNVMNNNLSSILSPIIDKLSDLKGIRVQSEFNYLSISGPISVKPAARYTDQGNCVIDALCGSLHSIS